MIITRTPYRISFFGGGTDYPSWYKENGGATLCTTIDKYCYITCRSLPPFFEHKYRIVYRKVECCQSVDQIRHPSVREMIRLLKIDNGLEIHHDGDLPARSGMGSSSSFTVGLLHALYAYKGMMPSKKKLASESINIEQNILKETVGSQDQVCAAYGGFNRVEFRKNCNFDVSPLMISPQRLTELNSSLMLFYTGIIRTASDIASGYVGTFAKNDEVLRRMYEMVNEGLSILQRCSDINEFGELLDEAWNLKKSLSQKISNKEVDDLYRRAKSCGAIGGKITGAGGGGFLLLFVPPKHQGKVREELGEKIHVPIKFETDGSRVLFYEPDKKYDDQVKDRANRVISTFRELKAKPAGSAKTYNS